MRYHLDLHYFHMVLLSVNKLNCFVLKRQEINEGFQNLTTSNKILDVLKSR